MTREFVGINVIVFEIRLAGLFGTRFDFVNFVRCPTDGKVDHTAFTMFCNNDDGINESKINSRPA